MADTIVCFVAEKLMRLLAKEAQLLGGLQDDVRSLHGEIDLMKGFLNGIKGDQKEDDLVRKLVTQIRNVTHEAEDVIDTYVAHRIKQARAPTIKNFGGSVLRDHRAATEIKRIKTTIGEILKRKESYRTEGGGRDRGGEAERIWKQRREVEEKEVIGFESYSKVLIDRLMSLGLPLNAVSIIGMGGLGKTTLARKIYTDNRVKDEFPCRAWGYASNEFRARDFFLTLLKCLLSSDRDIDEGTSEEDLKMKVRECLTGNKYLVVVDDVWETQDWNEVKSAFPDDNNGSRILITSRLANVTEAYRTGSTLPHSDYSLPFLNKPKSWELLSKKVFREQKCPPHLKNLGKLIAESCDGLPLAIIVMAGILAKRNSSPMEWSKIKDHVHRNLEKDNRLKDTLRLSYDNMHPRLKPCFLYFGMYPEDYIIPAKQLIQLWISEGLSTQEATGCTEIPELEQIAEDYLRELVDRSLVQVVRRTSEGGVKTCRIHNVLRHLCVLESRKDEFFDVRVKIDSQTHPNYPCPRRLSLHGALFDSSSSTATTLSDSSVSATRSLLCFGQKVSEVKPENWDWLLKSFKLARVLDLGQMNVSSLHEGLKRLIHLRYLRIASHSLETIPATICMLWNLETLDLRGSTSPIKSFSGQLWQLKQLRHLLMHGPVGLPEMPSETQTMPNLRTLSTVVLDVHTASLLDNGRFPGLTKLGLHYEKRGTSDNNPRVQLQSLRHLSQLRKVKVVGTTEIPKIAADVFPSKITKISLTKFGFFNSSAMTTLGKLPNLSVLKLLSQKSNVSYDLHCAAGGFPRLLVFVMVGIKVKSWRLGRGSMPCVGRVVIRNCSLLTQLPKELWSLRTLREVNVSWPCTELAQSLQNLELKNECKLVVYPLNQTKN